MPTLGSTRVRAVPPLLSPLPPWLVLSGLIGVINAAACFMLVGRDAWRLAWYALVGMLAAGVGQVIGTAVQAPQPLAIGDVNVMAVSVAACGLVLMARAFGL